MTNKPTAQNVQNIFNRQQTKSRKATEYAVVGQDKNALSRDRKASRQPASSTIAPRPQSFTNQTAQIHAKTGSKKRTVCLSLWVDPVVKAELARRAASNNLSISATGSAFLKRALQENIDTEYGALFEPIIRHEIGRQMRTYSSRIALLLVRVA